MIADNRLSETSAWDDQLLAEQLKELSELNLDFSLEATGFEMGEIDLRIAGLESVPDPKEDPGDKLTTFGCSIDIGLCTQARSKSPRTRAYWRSLVRRWFSPTRPTTSASKQTSAAVVRFAIAIS